MDRQRLMPTLKLAGLLLVLQAGAILAWFVVDERRGVVPGVSLEYERIEGRAASDLELERADGSFLRLSDLRGRWVLLHFWATWCPPCREELPALLDLGRQLGEEDGLVLLAVAVKEPWDAVRHFFDGTPPSEIVRDRAGDGHTGYGVSTLPDTYLVSPEGRIELRFAGARDWRSTAARALLQKEMSRSARTGP